MLPSANEVESVSEFTARVKYVLEKEIRSVWVRGEVSNLRRQASGHVYFSLKDAGSQVSGVMFRRDAVKQDVELQNGMQVVVFGEISVYAPRGNYQLIIRMTLEDGLGRLQREFELLKHKLADEGLFDRDRKRPIPRFPQTVGLITSASGAALQDMLRILKRREWRGRIVILPSKVQGEGAATEMIEQVQRAKELGIFDLLVIGRGGGSLEDLWCFNDESLVRALADCPIPVMSAVGHEIDFTLCDFVADMRAETPSGAAEIISSHLVELLRSYHNLRDRLEQGCDWCIGDLKERLEQMRYRFDMLHPKKRWEAANQRLDDLDARFHGLTKTMLQGCRQKMMEVAQGLYPLHPSQRLHAARISLKGVEGRFAWHHEQALCVSHERLRHVGVLLKSLSPEHTLRRGYVMLQDATSDEYITRARDVDSGSRIKVRFADGEKKMRAD